MKVCIPTMQDDGMESLAYSHFGSAPYFVVVDTESEETKAIQNKDLHHAHGACHPLGALEGENISVIIVGGIGRRAITRLNDGGVRVYQSLEGTVKENIDGLINNKLRELTPMDACSHHAHGCNHKE